MVALLSAIGAVVVFGSVLAKLAMDWHDHTNNPHKRRYSIVVGVLGFLAVLAAVFGAVKSYRDGREAAVRNQELTDTVSSLKQMEQVNADRARDLIIHLSDQVAELKTQAVTEELQEKISALQSQLSLALAPKPMAVLEPSFEAAKMDEIPISKTTTPLVDGVATVRFILFNKSDVLAINGIVLVLLPPGYTFAKEPDGFTQIPGAGNERQYVFARLEGRVALQTFTIQVRTPADSGGFQMAVKASCDNCAPSKEYLRKLLVMLDR